MLNAYVIAEERLHPLPTDQGLDQAAWVDLYRPLDSQVTATEALGPQIPSLADMEEIEISSRLYIANEVLYMTAVIPGQTPDGKQIAGPVSFILDGKRLITVRYHAPRPFEIYPDRAGRTVSGCASAERIFLGLMEEMIARMADLLEGVGKELDERARMVFGGLERNRNQIMKETLEQTGRQGELVAKVRLGLLSMERVLSFFSTIPGRQQQGARLKQITKGHFRDIQALEVHADSLTSRISMLVDATLGMIDLEQSNTMRVLSVVSALFMPPTLIASTYGMNFKFMPELNWAWGYPMVIGLMLASAAICWLVLRWKNWL